MTDLTCDLGFTKLKNPIIPASGTFGYGEEFLPFFDLDILGAFVAKGVYLKAREGNPPPRISETCGGLLNSIGLAGPGAMGLVEKLKKLKQKSNVPTIVNVCGGDDEEYLKVAQIFDDCPQADFLEINISCPNVHKGGKCVAQDSAHTYELMKRIKEKIKKPIIAKLSPNVADIKEVALMAEKGGADAISLVNTFLGMAVNLKEKKTVFKNIFAGLSGPAIKPLALKLVFEVAQCVQIPVIGIGGISSGKDVLEFILCGASAVQTGTINMIEPNASIRILKEIEEITKDLKINSLNELKGAIKHER